MLAFMTIPSHSFHNNLPLTPLWRKAYLFPVHKSTLRESKRLKPEQSDTHTTHVIPTIIRRSWTRGQKYQWLPEQTIIIPCSQISQMVWVLDHYHVPMSRTNSFLDQINQCWFLLLATRSPKWCRYLMLWRLAITPAVPGLKAQCLVPRTYIKA